MMIPDSQTYPAGVTGHEICLLMRESLPSGILHAFLFHNVEIPDIMRGLEEMQLRNVFPNQSN